MTGVELDDCHTLAGLDHLKHLAPIVMIVMMMMILILVIITGMIIMPQTLRSE